MNEAIGRAKGGIARANRLTPEERSAIASRGGKARHGLGDGNQPILRATHGSPDHPLRIGDIEIPCYVLEDGTRVLSQRGVIGGLGMSTGGSPRDDRLTAFLVSKPISPHVSNELMATIRSPIKFRTPTGGNAGNGYPATILADICDAVLSARRNGDLNRRYDHISDRAELLVRGFARVGIVALVDEATGYQKDRARDALAQILQAFIAKELQPYIPTFSADYFEQIFRLRGLEYPSGTVKRPQYFGMLTNDIVYKRLAPGVLEELKRVTPRNESGRHKNKLFQRLTTNIGYPKLREHLGSVVSIMKLSSGWHDFMGKLDRLHPRYGETLQLPLEYKTDDDDGKGL